MTHLSSRHHTPFHTGKQRCTNPNFGLDLHTNAKYVPNSLTEELLAQIRTTAAGNRDKTTTTAAAAAAAIKLQIANSEKQTTKRCFSNANVPA